jgi:hypothetical protein
MRMFSLEGRRGSGRESGDRGRVCMLMVRVYHLVVEVEAAV